MMTADQTADQQRARHEAEGSGHIIFDLEALRATATRTDAGPEALVGRAFIKDVYEAILDPSRIKLLRRGEAPTPLVIA